MIVGIGVDTVDIERFELQLNRTPALRQRLFTEAENDLPIRSLAARFAAKEALIKAMRGSYNLTWHDLEVVRGSNREPLFAHHQPLVTQLAALGATRTHLSLSHDGTMATAFVVIESSMEGGHT